MSYKPEDTDALQDAQAEQRAADEYIAVQYALGDTDRKLTPSQLTRRAHEFRQKADRWDEWCEAQNRVEKDMPQGWRVVLEMSPGDWSIYLEDPDFERVEFDQDYDTTAQRIHSAVEAAIAKAA